MSLYRPVVLTILDGWGCREESQGNAVAQARLPVMDGLFRDCPYTQIEASASAVGLPAGQMGSSEVGHLHMGAGRVVYQEYARINRAIEDGSFHRNPELTAAVDAARTNGGTLHLLGLLSDGGVHSHQAHLEAMVELAVARGAPRVLVHAFLDGRDAPPYSAMDYIDRLERFMQEAGGGRIATVVGRYYAMDRDRRWHRVRAAYDLLTQGQGFSVATPGEAVELAYERGESDEFVQPSVVVDADGAPLGTLGDGDAVVFMNFRSDRARQITRPFIEPGFDQFPREVVPALSRFVCLTEYNDAFEAPVAFPPQRLRNILGEYLAEQGIRQLRVAETEKYAHVTFFFNGGEEKPFTGEERILVHSPAVTTYDQQPEMSAYEVTAEVIRALDEDTYDVIVVNYANADMVGHCGVPEATVQALEALDDCLGSLVEAVRQRGGQLLVTADHGNAEQTVDSGTGQAHTAHTTNPVPLIYVGERPVALEEGGALGDIAPTLITLLGLESPAEMTGRSLVRVEAPAGRAEGL